MSDLRDPLTERSRPTTSSEYQVGRAEPVAVRRPPNPVSTASIAGHPLHPMLIPFPIAFFVSTLVCDLVFWGTRSEIWSIAALWLLGAGLIMAALAAVAGLTDFIGDRRIRDISDAWQHARGT